MHPESTKGYSAVSIRIISFSPSKCAGYISQVKLLKESKMTTMRVAPVFYQWFNSEKLVKQVMYSVFVILRYNLL
ncbi:hypothetical protein VAE122_2960160 [Vibrio aestuarianus]|nr:hypothetical protein VAE122_2960160 [Vibrio aestuarianus]